MWILIGLLGLLLFIVLMVILSFFGLWLRARLSGVRITYANLIGMTLRKVSATVIVQGMIMSTKAGLQLSVADLEAHYLAGGNVTRVVFALIAANKANIELEFKKAAPLLLVVLEAKNIT